MGVYKRSASEGNQWVWTALTESLKGVRYPVSEVRKEGQPVWECKRKTVPISWFEKGYVMEAPIEGQLKLFEVV